MAAPQTLIDAVDRIIDDFNRRKLDLPDGFFSRKTQFLINGAPFETLLSTAPNDPLILMLARGPAGYRFTVQALQHAIPDVKVERGDLVTDGDPFGVTTKLWLSGTLRGNGGPINALVTIHLRLTEAGPIESAAATMNETELAAIREARLKP